LELHTLLTEPELAGAQFILYFNWKKIGGLDAKEAELKAEDKTRIELDMMQDLELTGFRDYVHEVLDPLNLSSIDLEGDTARKERTDEMRSAQLEGLRKAQSDAEKKAKAAKEAKEAKDAKKKDDPFFQKEKTDEKKKAKDVGKLKPLKPLPRAMVVAISSEEQLFVNLDIRVNMKAEVKDADDELYDVL